MTHRDEAIARDRLRRALIAFQTALWAEKDQQVPAEIQATAAKLITLIDTSPEAKLSGIDPTVIAKERQYLAKATDDPG
jgi:hypothetical protein